MTADTLVIIQFTLLAAALTGALVVLQIAQDQYSHAVMRLLLVGPRVAAPVLGLAAVPVASMFLAGRAAFPTLELLTVAMTLMLLAWSLLLIRTLSPEAIARLAPSHARLGLDASFGVATGCARRFDFSGAQSAVAGYFLSLPPAGRWQREGIVPREVAGQLADILVLALREGDRNVVVERWLGEFRAWFSQEANLAGADLEAALVPLEALSKVAQGAEGAGPGSGPLAAELADALVFAGAAFARMRRQPPFDRALAMAAFGLKRLEAWPAGAGLWMQGLTVEDRLAGVMSRQPEMAPACNILSHAAGMVVEFAAGNLAAPEAAFLIELTDGPAQAPRDWQPTGQPGLYIVRSGSVRFEPPPGARVRAVSVTDPRLFMTGRELPGMFAARIAAESRFE